jgi:hypothetical protein
LVLEFLQTGQNVAAKQQSVRRRDGGIRTVICAGRLVAT